MIIDVSRTALKYSAIAATVVVDFVLKLWILQVLLLSSSGSSLTVVLTFTYM
jgi:hypothetical protein